MKIKIVEPVIEDDDVEMVIKVLKSKWLVHGPVVEEFEKRFAEYLGVRHALAVMNGTIALDLILKAIGIGPGDEVIVPDFTFIATANTVLMQGARPVFADIELETYNIDPDDVLEKITSKTRAIIAVHLYGHPADMNSLREIAEDYKLYLIEDAAQAHGAEINGVKVGSIGDAAAFSFYATKNMTTGEGGIVTTNIDWIAYKVAMLRNHGQEEKYNHVTIGGNYRITALQAALGLTQLKKLEKLNAKRRKNAEYLNSHLSSIKTIRIPREKPGYKHVWHQYVIWVKDDHPLGRDLLAKKLKEKGIDTAIHYPKPIHMQPLYKALGYPQNICPNSIEASRHVLSIPVHPLLTRNQLDYIANTIRELSD